MTWSRRATSFCLAAVAAGAIAAENPRPDWSALHPYQQTLTRAEFTRLLDAVYCPGGALTPYLTVTDEQADLFADKEKQRLLFTLHFAPDAPTRKTFRPPFKTFDDLRALHNPPDTPLRGLRIALDPGHIGGEYARMEERWFQLGPNRPIQEAALNLTVARLLKLRLEAAGATVLMVKDNFEPTTTKRPEDFHEEATKHVDEVLLQKPAEKEKLAALGPLDRTAYRADLIRKRMELHFYRHAEIQARADRVNRELRPDLTLCIHFNAHAWDNPPKLIQENALAVFTHGNYSADEVATEQQKFELMTKLLEGSHEIELAAAAKVAAVMAEATNLPPINTNPQPPTTNPYLIPRNFIANRLYRGPVLYLEPYYQNNVLVYPRLLAGDYDGEREIIPFASDGSPLSPLPSPLTRHRSIYREYADSVAKGLVEFYSTLTVTNTSTPK